MTRYTAQLRRATDDDWQRIGIVARYPEAVQVADVWHKQVLDTWPDAQVRVQDANDDTVYSRP